MTGKRWELSTVERETLGNILDLLLPPAGSFPLPSDTGIIDEFFLKRIQPASEKRAAYPGLDADGLKAILDRFSAGVDLGALRSFEREQPREFGALWSLAVYGYYSRQETIDAIQRDLTPGYHGAPLPEGYAHIIEPWDPDDPLQFPRQASGTYIRTEDVRRVDLSMLDLD